MQGMMSDVHLQLICTEFSLLSLFYAQCQVQQAAYQLPCIQPTMDPNQQVCARWDCTCKQKGTKQAIWGKLNLLSSARELLSRACQLAWSWLSLRSLWRQFRSDVGQLQVICTPLQFTISSFQSWMS